MFRIIDYYYYFFFFFFFFKDKCEQKPECCCCCCINKFHNDNNHQYILSNSHRLVPNKRLDLIALMQYNTLLLSFIQPFNDILSHSCVNEFNCKLEKFFEKIQNNNNKIHLILVDRSLSSMNFISIKDSLNRNCLSHDLFNKQSSLLQSSNCCHQHCTHLSTSTETCHSSLLIQQTNGQQYPLSKLISHNSLINDESQINRRIFNNDEIDCTTKLTCMITNNDGFRRKKSASLNSPANSGNKTKEFYYSKIFFDNFDRKSSNS